jgi:ubiquinol-cytochrome c reductase cytochrome b subunit
MFKVWFWLLVADFFLLMWCGGMSAEQPFVIISQLATAYWFGFFLVVLPLLGVMERPQAPPASIEEDFRAHYGEAQADGAGHAARPAE